MFVTVEGRLDKRLAPDVYDYALSHVAAYESVERKIWHKINHGVRTQKELSDYLKREHGFKQRPADTIARNMLARHEALLELKKTELGQEQEKLEDLQESIDELMQSIDNRKEDAGRNKLNEEELEKYRNDKFSLHQKNLKKDRMVKKICNLEKMIETEKLSMCFGTKKLFNAQFHLKESGFSCHKQWRKAFRIARDRKMEFMGKAQDTYGNQICHLIPTDTPSLFKIAICTYLQEQPDPGKKRKKSPYLTGLVRIPFQSEFLTPVLKKHASLPNKKKNRMITQPLTCRLLRRKKNALYIQVTIEIDPAPVFTTPFYGTVGIDYNAGFLEMAETGEDGNLIKVERYVVDDFGEGKRGEDNLNVAVKKIVSYAHKTGKDLAIEDLDFLMTKAQCQKASSQAGKKYNKMVHSLNYSHYKEKVQRECQKSGVDLKLVNPKNSSKNARKYARKKKLCIHSAAAWLIARRGGRKRLA